VTDERGVMPSGDDDLLRRLSSLGDANRRRLYEYVAAQPDPVSRDEAAAACGLERATAAYHLDRLVDDQLLAASFARLHGRGGPGAGRPAKHYTRAQADVTVTLPPRDYQLAAEILVRAAEADTSGALVGALGDAASEIARELVSAAGAHGSDLLALLREQGFEPYVDDEVVRLRNCPFHRLAQEHTELVCGMNHALLSAVADAVEPRSTVRLDPAPGRCCVAFQR
jgi:predicted ArsR family transcriptional regulator